MTKSPVVLSTLDTKGRETAFLKEQIEHDGCRAILCDIGVVGTPTIKADVTREQLAEAGGTPLADLLKDASREKAAPVMVKGAAKLIGERIAKKAQAAGVEQVAFDRAGFRYHGRVKALADAAREAGLKF